MHHARTSKLNSGTSFRHTSNRQTARRPARSNGHLQRAALAAVEALETRRLMSYTFTKLADLNNTTGKDPQAGLYMDSSGDLFGTTSSGGTGGRGTIFEIQAGHTNVVTLYNFSTTGPYNPEGGLIADSSGNLYGTTFGNAELGTAIYEFNPNTQSFTTLATFPNNGPNPPQGNLAMDSNGDLYGTTESGGDNTQGYIFGLTHNSGTIQVLASFDGATNGAQPEYDNVVMDSAGNLYGIATSGGADSEGDVWELPHNSSTIIDLVNFDGTTNGSSPYGGLTMDSAGNMYGTTDQGGANSEGTVFEIAAGTHAFSTLASLSSTTGENPESGLLVDASGNIFGTTEQGGTGALGTVFEIPANNRSTVDVLADFSSTNNNGYSPMGAALIMDSSGDLFGTTSNGGSTGGGTVFELSPVLPATQAVFTTQPSNTFTAGTSQSFAVSLESAGGAVDTGNTSNVTLSIDSGPSGATIGGTLTEAAVNGVATFSGLTFDEAGTYTLTAASTGLTSGTSETFTVNAGSPYQVAFAQQPTGSIAAGASLGTVTVDVEDQYGNVCTTGSPTYVLLSGTSLEGASSPEPATDGVATFTGLSMTQAGPQTLTATDHTLSSPTANSTSFTITPGAASKVAFTTEPSDGYAGIALAPIEASIEDEYGNLETTDTSDVSVDLIGSAALGGTTTQAAVAGVATFSDLTISAAGTGYSLLATSSGLTTGSSSSFDIGSAAVWTGDGGDGEWNTADNWQGDAVPTSGQPVDFPALSTTGTINLASDVNVGDIVFDGGGYTLSGPGQITTTGITANANEITISNQVNIAQNITVTVAAASDLQINSIDDGGNGYGVNKEGAGTLSFTGDSVYDGVTNLDQGSIELASGAGLDSAVDSSAGTSVFGNNASLPELTGTGGTIFLVDGGAPGTITTEGSFQLGSGMELNEAIGSSSSGEIIDTGTQLNISGATLNVEPLNGVTPTAGQVITLIENQTGDPVAGTFNGLPQGTVFTSNGVQYQISYTANGEDDVTLTVIGTAVWTDGGGDGQWNTADNWQGDAVPLAGQDVDFPEIDGSLDEVILGTDVTVGNIEIEGNYDFNGSSITVDGNITASGTDDAFSDNTDLTHDTTITINEDGNLNYSGTITDGGDTYGVTFAGSGTVQFDGEAAYGGPTVVQGVTLDNEYEVASAITVDSGGTVEGNGSFNGGIIGNGGTISLGNDSDSSTYEIDVPSATFANGTTVHEELGNNGGSGESDGVLIVEGGTIDLTGANLTLGTQNGFTPSVGDVITVIANNTGSPVTGTFTGLPEGTITTFDDVHYKVSYLGGESGHDVTLTVVNPVTNPTVVSVMPADVTPSARATLSILGEDPNTENDSDLTYTWSVAEAPSGAKPVKFSENGTNAAKDASARFQKAGTYHLLCTISDGDGGTTTQMVSVTIKQVKTSVRLEPHGEHIAAGATQQYTGVALDQFGHPMMGTQTITYAVETGDGTIDDSGLFTAGEEPGHVVIQMTVDGLTGVVGAEIV